MNGDEVTKFTKRDWRHGLAEYRKSGKGRKEWCDEFGVPISTFNGWLAREKR